MFTPRKPVVNQSNSSSTLKKNLKTPHTPYHADSSTPYSTMQRSQKSQPSTPLPSFPVRSHSPEHEVLFNAETHSVTLLSSLPAGTKDSSYTGLISFSAGLAGLVFPNQIWLWEYKVVSFTFF